MIKMKHEFEDKIEARIKDYFKSDPRAEEIRIEIHPDFQTMEIHCIDSEEPEQFYFEEQIRMFAFQHLEEFLVGCKTIEAFFEGLQHLPKKPASQPFKLLQVLIEEINNQMIDRPITRELQTFLQTRIEDPTVCDAEFELLEKNGSNQNCKNG